MPPFNGSGTFTVYTPGNPVVTATTISSTVHNATVADLATGLTNTVTRDGQSPPTANIPFGNFRLTGLGTGTARTDGTAVAQVQDSALIWGGTGGGTVDAITISTTPATAAHTTGAGFYFLSSGANTGAVTLNPNGIGAKSVTKNGATALAAGDIPSGAIVRVVYDGTRYQLMNVSFATIEAQVAAIVNGGLLEINIFTSSGTLTKHADADYWIVVGAGGGGAGGGAEITTAGQVSFGNGGGSGGSGTYRISTIPASATITIGGGGSGVSGASGGNGVASSIVGSGVNISFNGGTGGAVRGAAAPPIVGAIATNGSISPTTGGTLITFSTGNASSFGVALSATVAHSGSGNATSFGPVGTGRSSSAGGNAATANTGCGGGGALNLESNGSARSGGAGGSGFLVCYQYKSP